MLVSLTLVVILFEIWYVSAFLAAYMRLRESRLLLLVGQGMMILLAFAYIAYASLGGQPINPIIALAPLVLSMVALGIWRAVAGSVPRFAQSYPRGFIDVLLFRRPASNLKRRVRTK
ncbi:hypothetical protein EKD04_020140 [Chloroflexales bacterium ZM16-3]|nr:hypothetical protein [Chloroflexales bacterium ZM16-3]